MKIKPKFIFYLKMNKKKKYNKPAFFSNLKLQWYKIKIFFNFWLLMYILIILLKFITFNILNWFTERYLLCVLWLNGDTLFHYIVFFFFTKWFVDLLIIIIFLKINVLPI